MMLRRSRPAGVTILAVLQILIGVIGLLGSLAIVGLSALASTIPTIGALVGSIGLVIGGIALFFSIIWLATGIGFLHGRGWAWTLGMIFSVLSLLGTIGAFLIGLVTGGIVGFIFWTLMLYYLTRNHVKAFFGKGTMPYNPSYPMAYPSPAGYGQPPATNIPSYTPAPPPTISLNAPTLQTVGQPNPASQTTTSNSPSISAPQAGKALVSCPYCGSRLTMGSPKCLTCGATI
jgi:hypothetical protein